MDYINATDSELEQLVQQKILMLFVNLGSGIFMGKWS